MSKDKIPRAITRNRIDATDEKKFDNALWDDMRIDLNDVRLPSSNYPSWETFFSSEVLGFDVGENINFSVQLPHSYKEGSDIKFHLHTILETAGAGGGAENVQWQLTYTWANINDDFPTEETETVEYDVQDDTDERHYVTSVATLNGNGKKVSSVLLCNLERIAASANDYADMIYVISIDFHILKNTTGSRTEFKK